MNKLPENFKYSSGQALLIVLLSMAVVLTIVLSILSSTITDVAVTSREEEALRAFSAAEAGVEQALIGGSLAGSFGNASFTASISSYGQGADTFVFQDALFSGESATLWFVEHDEDTGALTCSGGNCFTGNQMTVCWGEDGTPADQATTPAIEVSIFYTDTPGDYSTVKIARDTADPNSNRRTTNKFGTATIGGCSIDGLNFAFQKNIQFDSLGIPSSVYNTQNGLQLARIRFFYNTDQAQPVGVDLSASGGTLPSQGKRIVSQGSAGEANRRIEVYQSFGELPVIFDSAAFSPGGIVK